MRGKQIDHTNERFGRLTVIQENGRYKGNVTWLCLCDCGNKVTVAGFKLRQGRTKSCGCYKKDHCKQIGRKTKHGLFGTYFYNAYYGAKQRCENKNIKSWHSYGGRGIKFLFDSIEDFVSEIGPRPTKFHSIDRIDNNGHYEPGNVRWATKREQNANQRRSVYVTINGTRKPASWWRRELGIPKTCYDCRINSGLSPEEALLKPYKKRKSPKR